MAGFSSILGSLATGLTELAAQNIGGQNVGGLASKAKTTWGNQSTLTKGAIAGGLLGVLLSGNARRLVGTGVEVGGAALIGSLAMKAFSDWQSGKQAAAAPANAAPPPLPSASGTAFLPTDPAQAEDLSHRLLQAMVAATKADGVVTPEERTAIDAHLADLGLGAEAEDMIRAQLDKPLDIGEVAALAKKDVNNPTIQPSLYVWRTNAATMMATWATPNLRSRHAWKNVAPIKNKCMKCSASNALSKLATLPMRSPPQGTI